MPEAPHDEEEWPTAGHEALTLAVVALLKGLYGNDLSPPDVLDELHALVDIDRAVDGQAAALIREARALGSSWNDIARAMRVSKVTTYKKFGPKSPFAIA